LSIKALFGGNLMATGVLIKLPTPPNAATAKIKVSTGKAKYVAQENAIVWKIARFAGGAECRSLLVIVFFFLLLLLLSYCFPSMFHTNFVIGLFIRFVDC
jgi:hypothetical protein